MRYQKTCTRIYYVKNEILSLLKDGILLKGSGYVRKYYDVKNRTFFRNFMHDFGHFYAQFLFFKHSKYLRCENRMKNMRLFLT